MGSNGYIKLFRKMTDWEWYRDSNAKCVFLHCLLLANHDTVKWQGIEIKAGQFATSLPSISKATGVSVQSVRTSLTKLKSTGELTYTSTNKFRLVTIANWASYQSTDPESTDKSTTDSTDNQQATNRQLTANKKDKKDKNDKKIISITENQIERKKFGEFGNVLLSDSQYSEYCSRYGKSVIDKYIGEVDLWFGNNPKICKARKNNHLLTLVQFLKKANIKEIPKPVQPELETPKDGTITFDIDTMLKERGIDSLGELGKPKCENW